jgi:hypothetical protein
MSIEEICSAVTEHGYYYLPGCLTMTLLAAEDPQAFADRNLFQESWSRLPWDQYVPDRYRRRRYAALQADSADSSFTVKPNQPHYQSMEHNHVFGGISRMFEPVESEVLNASMMRAILGFTLSVTDMLLPTSSWSVELHQFRIEATGARSGDPTPEGMHRDGVDYVHILMVSRHNLTGGTSIINGNSNNHLADYLLSDAFDMLVLDDHKVQHSVEPVSCLDFTKVGYRDVLVATYRSTDPTR